MSLLACNSSIPSSRLRNWNEKIKKNVHLGNPENAVLTYLKMQELNFHGDNYTFPLLIKAAGRICDSNLGFALHGQAVKSGFYDHVFVQTALINMYGAFGFAVEACKVFDKMTVRDLVAWNSMLDVYASNGQMDDAVDLFNSMLLKDVSSFNVMISGYSNHGEVLLAREIFNEMAVRDTVSWNSMMLAYTRAGDVKEAFKLFREMPVKNVITWNTMITGCLQSECFDKVLDLFEEMKNTDTKPDYLTVTSVLSAATHLGSLETGIEIHVYALCNELALSPHVITALIEMYAKCGSIEQALLVFFKSEKKDIFCWNAIISAFALHGYGYFALEIFENMRMNNVKPDDITFIGLLNACSHSGLVQEGCELFNSMEKYFGISPKLEHYGCIIDLLSRAGFLVEAYRVIESMPFEPTESVLGAMLNGCVIHKDVEIGKRVTKLISLRAKWLSDGELIMFSNLYASCGDWEEANRWREMMNESGIVKIPGQSMIEVNGKFQKFLAGDMKKDYPTIVVIQKFRSAS